MEARVNIPKSRFQMSSDEESLVSNFNGTESSVYVETLRGKNLTDLTKGYSGIAPQEGCFKFDETLYFSWKIKELDERLGKVEDRLYSDIIEKLTSFNNRTQVAKETMDPGLMTSIARNEGLIAEVRTCYRVVKRYHFATFQCLLMIVVMVAMLSFGITQLWNVDESMSSQYKPFKVQRKDEFYLNEDLKYILPEHYILFHIQGYTPKFADLYNNTFNKTCEKSLDSCFTEYMYYFLTKSDESAITAECHMIAHDIITGVFSTTITRLSNFSIFTDIIGTKKLLGTNSKVLGMLIKLEFEDLTTHMNGPLSCTLGLDMDMFKKILPGFGYDIYFMVSRSDYDSGLTGYSDYISAWSRVWRWTDLVGKNFIYLYDESTFDQESEFKAEIYVEKRLPQEERVLRIETYPNPTIVHYVSFDNYSYIDWMADIGGFSTLAIGFFLFAATRITKFANRNKAFHTVQGILPIFSLPHRNAEELAGLRFIVLAGLGITEEEYFGKEFQNKLTNLIHNDV